MTGRLLSQRRRRFSRLRVLQSRPTTVVDYKFKSTFVSVRSAAHAIWVRVYIDFLGVIIRRLEAFRKTRK
jgi:hypothetical protein